ncbi:MAG: hypothetical protein A2Z21_05880 [Candidatus Fraserbacteria bacterium RBG_16_55_9]|uniref:4Fe-4S ferredoxin-type domain-containing protein n=1 Tax=Fraserbacteria sp. (strain RBG_16_55_9) TaxID=1817864 RepID=A0A1F5UZ19_FRAXR|nr:MAG: hypothetical protein A2Z21_05880 [Candidatus Fraserbacteria bacterium RBG_16_55_9]
MKDVRVNPFKCKACWNSEPGFRCVVPNAALYDIFRSQQKIRSGGSRKMPIPPCVAACPANICVQGYVGLTAAGLYDQAYRLIRSRVPFPHTLSLVCPQPCEGHCIHVNNGQPIAINALKRFVAERAVGRIRRKFLDELKSSIVGNGMSIAVVGAGPAGLTAAHDLRLRGYSVTVYEALENPGGMLYAGIPAFRLPRSVLDQEIKEILELGIELKTGVRIGQDIPVEELWKGHSAIFLAAGAHHGGMLKIPGAEAEGVMDALKFLREVNRGGRPRVGPRVAVIGGGDSALDAARVARRLGAEEVSLCYRRSRIEMPAHPDQVEQAEAEGIEIIEQAAPIRFLTQNERLISLESVRMELGALDGSGRRRPIPIPDSNFTVGIDTALVAIGQRPDSRFLKDLGLILDHRGWVEVGGLGMTSVERLFAGGDLVSGPSTVIEAIAAGKRAAGAIDRYLRGETAKAATFHTPHELKNVERYKPSHVSERVKTAQRDPSKRVSDFHLVDLGLTEMQVQAEARRCLVCGLCANCNACVDTFACPALLVSETGKIVIDGVLCNECGICAQLCPNDAIEVIEVEREEAVGAR